jgi:RHS repeat-associated protein
MPMLGACDGVIEAQANPQFCDMPHRHGPDARKSTGWRRYLSPQGTCGVNRTAVHFTYMRAAALGFSSRYPYRGMAYAGPDAVTQIANGLSTTTFTYDNNGNVTQKTVDGTTTTYVYDYANRLTALGAGGATTTYGYDAFGTRVLQTGTTTTTIYPFKWYSVASSTGTGAKYATTTDYVLNSDTLLATVDQQTASGVATGTAKTRYIHPDHLGSTNVVTDENDNVVQTLDYYPYGGTRISVATSTNEKRKFIGQFVDDSTLSYLNARYYEGSRGQFLSEDPAFLAIGNPGQLQQLSQPDQQRFLADPQQINSYSYGRDNPITYKDPQGLWALRFGIAGTIPLWGLSGEIGIQADLRGVDYYYDAGLAGGGGFSFGPQITTADLSHQYSISTAAFAQGGSGISVEMSKGMMYYPYSDRKPESYQEGSLGFPAVELAGGVMSEVSGPIRFPTWSNQSSVNYSLPRPQMVNSLNTSSAQGINSQSVRSSSSGGGSSYAQVLSNLMSVLQQLSAVLSAYKSSNTSH